jgi:hypothetical protein
MRKLHHLQGKALLEAQLRQAEQNGASAEQIAALRQTAASKGLGAALAGLESLRTPPAAQAFRFALFSVSFQPRGLVFGLFVFQGVFGQVQRVERIYHHGEFLRFFFADGGFGHAGLRTMR